MGASDQAGSARGESRALLVRASRFVDLSPDGGFFVETRLPVPSDHGLGLDARSGEIASLCRRTGYGHRVLFGRGDRREPGDRP